jgi:hypothetical protein
LVAEAAAVAAAVVLVAGVANVAAVEGAEAGVIGIIIAVACAMFDKGGTARAELGAGVLEVADVEEVVVDWIVGGDFVER